MKLTKQKMFAFADRLFHARNSLESISKQLETITEL